MSYILSFPLPAHIRKNEVQDRINKLSNDQRSIRYNADSNTICIRSTVFDLIVEAKNNIETPQQRGNPNITKRGDKYVGKYPIHPDIVSQRLISRTIGRRGCLISEIEGKCSVRIHVGDKPSDYNYSITGTDSDSIETAYELLQKNEYSVLYETSKQNKQSESTDEKVDAPIRSRDDGHRDDGRRRDERRNEGRSEGRRGDKQGDAIIRKFPIHSDIPTYKLFSPLIGQRGSCLDRITQQVKSKSYISVSKDTLEYTIGSGSAADLESVYELLQKHEQEIIDAYHAHRQQRQERSSRVQTREPDHTESPAESDADEQVVAEEPIPSPRKERRVRSSEERNAPTSWADAMEYDDDDEICDILDNLPSITRK